MYRGAAVKNDERIKNIKFTKEHRASSVIDRILHKQAPHDLRTSYLSSLVRFHKSAAPVNTCFAHKWIQIRLLCTDDLNDDGRMALVKEPIRSGGVLHLRLRLADLLVLQKKYLKRMRPEMQHMCISSLIVHHWRYLVNHMSPSDVEKSSQKPMESLSARPCRGERHT